MDSVEISVKGEPVRVPSVLVEGRNVITTGRWIRTASIVDEEFIEAEPLSEPEAFVSRLKNAPLAADVFTFSQRVPDVVQKFQYRVHWDNRAAIRITTYADWLDNRAQYDVKKAVKRAKKLGVVVRTAVYDDAFVEGIRRIYDESPIRQNQVFWHYHKDFATVKRENGTFLDRSEYIGAYYNDQLIGFIKMVYVGSVASAFQVISQKKHSATNPPMPSSRKRWRSANRKDSRTLFTAATAREIPIARSRSSSAAMVLNKLWSRSTTFR